MESSRVNRARKSVLLSAVLFLLSLFQLLVLVANGIGSKPRRKEGQSHR